MRGPVLCIIAVGLLGAAAAAADDGASSCASSSCGAPSCWDTKLRTRPGATRELTLHCQSAVGASVATGPATGDVTVNSADFYGVHLTLHEPETAPPSDHMVLHVEGHEHAVDVPVDIDVIPTTQNDPPVCWDDKQSQRSDGSTPVEFYLHPICFDPDGDDFVMEGGGPGYHRLSPKHVQAGENDPNWYYRPSITSGTETATIWATDSLGARSADATLTVSLGPDVDRLPFCHPNPYMTPAPAVYEINSRPGAQRHFAVICDDADTDPLTPVLVSGAQRGTISTFAPQRPLDGFWGRSVWVDTVYDPADASMEPDELSVQATGSRGDSPVQRFAIVPHDDSFNSGGGCGWWPIDTAPDTAGEARMICDDGDGDPLSAEVVDGPLHGTAGPPAIVADLFGQSRITVPYTPAPGYKGYDCIQVLVSDGHGMATKIQVDISVRDLRPASMPAPSPPPPVAVATVPRSADDTAGSSTKRTPVAARLLGTNAVARIAAARTTARIWAPKHLSKRGLLLKQSVPGLAVICPRDCEVRAEVRLAGGPGHRRRGRRQQAVLLGVAGQASVMSLFADRADRRLLRLPERPVALFRLRVRVGQGAPVIVRRVVPVGL